VLSQRHFEEKCLLSYFSSTEVEVRKRVVKQLQRLKQMREIQESVQRISFSTIAPHSLIPIQNYGHPEEELIDVKKTNDVSGNHDALDFTNVTTDKSKIVPNVTFSDFDSGIARLSNTAMSSVSKLHPESNIDKGNVGTFLYGRDRFADERASNPTNNDADTTAGLIFSATSRNQDLYKNVIVDHLPIGKMTGATSVSGRNSTAAANLFDSTQLSNKIRESDMASAVRANLKLEKSLVSVTSIEYPNMKPAIDIQTSKMLKGRYLKRFG
jgi:hypothetical protein